MKRNITIKVNGTKHTVNIDSDTPLLYILRNNLSLNGPKFGCGLGQCGACMVLFNGNAVPSCQLSMGNIGDGAIVTLEGLLDREGSLHKVQKAFVEEQAAQCGYCLNGMVISSVSLLQKNSIPSEEEIRSGLQRNICRCGVHARVIKAVKKASGPEL